MEKHGSWNAVAGLVLALLLLVTPAAADSSGAGQKIFIVNFLFDDHGVTAESAGIWYGTAPDPGIQSGPIEGILADSHNNALTKFYLRDPRYQTGDSFVRHDDGTVSVAGYTQYTPSVKTRVVLPYSPDAQTLSLVDTGTGTTLVTVDMVQAGSRLAESNPEDQKFAGRITSVDDAGSGTSGPLIPPWIFLTLGIVLIAGSVFLTVLSVRLPEHAGGAMLRARVEAVLKKAGRSARAGAAGFTVFCRQAVERLYHTSVLINFALIFAMVFVMLQGSFVIAGHNVEGILFVMLIFLEIPALFLLNVSLVTTHRSLVTNRWP